MAAPSGLPISPPRVAPVTLYDSSGNALQAGLPQGTATGSAAAPTSVAAVALAANVNRKTAIIYNNGSVTVYLGGSGVTTANGLPLLPGAAFVDDRTTGVWYGVTASGTGDLRIIEVA